MRTVRCVQIANRRNHAGDSAMDTLGYVLMGLKSRHRGVHINLVPGQNVMPCLMPAILYLIPVMPAMPCFMPAMPCFMPAMPCFVPAMPCFVPAMPCGPTSHFIIRATTHTIILQKWQVRRPARWCGQMTVRANGLSITILKFPSPNNPINISNNPYIYPNMFKIFVTTQVI